MGVAIKWLKEYVDFNLTAEDLAHKLTMAGIAVEGLEKTEDDAILELELTPNRGDCLGMINLAREVAALTGSQVRIPKIDIRENEEDVNDYIKVNIEEPHLCLRYAARVIKNVKIEPSPAWMQKRLMQAGIRPINNVVDITNYVLLETNQPLHAFDYDLFTAREINVRRARPGERFTTLDGVERELDEEMLLICDGDRGVALAGIMGGLNTEINEKTTTVMLEAAYFAPGNIRKTSRKLALRSDSSIRFEKGADPNGIIYAINRAAMLIQELAGGEVVKGVVDVYPHPVASKKIELRPERVNYLLGTELTPDVVKSYMERLGWTWEEKGDCLLVEIPTYRPDITREVDLIEEVARLYGYENIPSALPYGDTTVGGLTPYQEIRENIRTIMAESLYEVVNYSFINPVLFDKLMLPPDSNWRNVVKIANPLSEEQSVMRTLLLPGLLENLSRNFARQNSNLAFFEMGAVFYPRGEELPEEKLKVGAAVAGMSDLNWLKHQVVLDFFFLKGIVEDLLRRLGIRDYQFKKACYPFLHPGRTAEVWAEGEVIGFIGEVHPEVGANFDLRDRACVFEFDVDTLFKLSQKKRMMENIARYPSVERDIAVLLKDEITAGEAVDVIRKSDDRILREVIVFDLYKGEQITPGYKSMAFRLKFQSNERTLTENEVNDVVKKILDNLERELEAKLR
ncbi:phenylalanyl-tRNA synthetase beta subunit [Thermosyntropha lipolytica DSM 11003]|uniref:Phenylalanine--tRNA ligase beta subunit n=1 Tax=Thermosyntropha lipolytica DSM 11003 TaxID=1123382 RepID=A0A1M5K5L7_9FIRM|nr:phenylalanine--tRNA ligase subunit beta [Thermosyntropha lipolytica]SHG47870.1 phenylalanyl-tRNA synthetase beta subunit [Thermosyntropha lipolytica DSM 11003]